MFRTIIAMALVLGLVGAARQAQAGQLITPALPTGGGNNLNCRLMSLRDVTDATIQIRDSTGGVAASAGFNLVAGQTNSASDFTPPNISYCVVAGKGITHIRFEGARRPSVDRDAQSSLGTTSAAAQRR